MRPRRVLVYKDDSGGFRFRARSGNGRVVGASEESRTHLDATIEAAHAQFPDAVVRVRYDEADYVVRFDEDSL